MGRTTCADPQCLYNRALYLFSFTLPREWVWGLLHVRLLYVFIVVSNIVGTLTAVINNIAIMCAMKVIQPWLWDTNICLLDCGALHCNADLATHQRNILHPEDVDSRLSCDVEYIYTGLFEMFVGFLTTCHTQDTWDRSICFFFI